MKKNQKHVGDLEIVMRGSTYSIYRVTKVTANGSSAEPTGVVAATYDEACNLINKMREDVNEGNALRKIMIMAWQFVKRNGYTMSEALKCAWANFRLRQAMAKRIVRFYFRKVDGTIREAFGTLVESLCPETKGADRKKNDTLQVYYDTERQEYRSFKRANLINVA